jgi:hypothetical protein
MERRITLYRSRRVGWDLGLTAGAQKDKKHERAIPHSREHPAKGEPMKKIALQDQKREGLFPEHKGVAPVEQKKVRLTLHAIEALQASGATITDDPMDEALGIQTHMVQMGASIPTGLVVAATHIPCQDGYGYLDVLSLRMEVDPPYHDEQDADYWRRLDFMPCPKCGSPLVWYEAGYVPGYRVCTKKPHHHWLAQ